MKKIILVLSIIFFPVTIIFSPIIMMLVDIRRKQLIIVSLSEQILAKLSGSSSHSGENIYLSQIADSIEQMVVVGKILDQKELRKNVKNLRRS